MSSTYRCDSPPPRMPSPDISYNPLPIRSRRTNGPRFPPGLEPPRTLEKSKSTGDLHGNRALKSATPERVSSTPQSTRTSLPPSKSVLKVTPPVSPAAPPYTGTRFISVNAAKRNSNGSTRSLSLAIPYLSPPPSPTIASPPPPVPPIPAFVLSAPTPATDAAMPDSGSRSDRSLASRVVRPVELPDVISPISETVIIPSARKGRVATTTGKGPSKGLSCMDFFSLKNSKNKRSKNAPLISNT